MWTMFRESGPGNGRVREKEISTSCSVSTSVGEGRVSLPSAWAIKQIARGVTVTLPPSGSRYAPEGSHLADRWAGKCDHELAACL